MLSVLQWKNSEFLGPQNFPGLHTLMFSMHLFYFISCTDVLQQNKTRMTCIPPEAREEGGQQGHVPPNFDWGGAMPPTLVRLKFCTYYKISWIFPPAVSYRRLQNVPNSFCAGVLPRTLLVSLQFQLSRLRRCIATRPNTLQISCYYSEWDSFVITSMTCCIKSPLTRW